MRLTKLAERLRRIQEYYTIAAKASAIVKGSYASCTYTSQFREYFENADPELVTVCWQMLDEADYKDEIKRIVRLRAGKGN